MAEARYKTPKVLPGATAFSDDPEMVDPVWLLTTLKQTSWAFDELDAAARALEHRHGRKRLPGSWPLIYFAFVISGEVDIKPWWSRTPDSLWQVAGFSAKPPYLRVYDRFTELEEIRDEFNNAAAKLIAHGRRHEPMIGHHVHVDSTEAETHAALVHDDEKCGCDRSKVPHVSRADTSQVRHKRHTSVEELPDDKNQDIFEQTYGDLSARSVREEQEKLSLKVGGHWFRSLDTTAGARWYGASRRFWFGFYCTKVIDHATGAPLAIHFSSASVNEAKSYPTVYEKLVANLGDRPGTVVADRGYSFSSIFEHNTTRGVATVAPWRRTGKNAPKHAPDSSVVDRHGVPRCRYCKAPTTFVKFVENSGQGANKPRVYFRCTQGRTADCQTKLQSVYCSEEWRLLVPLWQDNPIYQELSSAHSQYERVHLHWRNRYRVAPDTLAFRPKRRGIKWQELRANAALVVEWLRILSREGWLGSARRNGRDSGRHGERFAESMNERKRRVTERLDDLAKERRKANLHLRFTAAGKPVKPRAEART